MNSFKKLGHFYPMVVIAVSYLFESKVGLFIVQSATKCRYLIVI